MVMRLKRGLKSATFSVKRPDDGDFFPETVLVVLGGRLPAVFFVGNLRHRDRKAETNKHIRCPKEHKLSPREREAIKTISCLL